MRKTSETYDLPINLQSDLIQIKMAESSFQIYTNDLSRVLFFDQSQARSCKNEDLAL